MAADERSVKLNPNGYPNRRNHSYDSSTMNIQPITNLEQIQHLPTGEYKAQLYEKQFKENIPINRKPKVNFKNYRYVSVLTNDFVEEFSCLTIDHSSKKKCFTDKLWQKSNTTTRSAVADVSIVHSTCMTAADTDVLESKVDLFKPMLKECNTNNSATDLEVIVPIEEETWVNIEDISLLVKPQTSTTAADRKVLNRPKVDLGPWRKLQMQSKDKSANDLRMLDEIARAEINLGSQRVLRKRTRDTSTTDPEMLEPIKVHTNNQRVLLKRTRETCTTDPEVLEPIIKKAKVNIGEQILLKRQRLDAKASTTVLLPIEKENEEHPGNQRVLRTRKINTATTDTKVLAPIIEKSEVDQAELQKCQQTDRAFVDTEVLETKTNRIKFDQENRRKLRSHCSVRELAYSEPLETKITIISYPDNKRQLRSHDYDTTAVDPKLFQARTRGQNNTRGNQTLLKKHSTYQPILTNLERLSGVVEPLLDEYRKEQYSTRKTESLKCRFENLNTSVTEMKEHLFSKKEFPFRSIKESNDTLAPSVRICLVISPKEKEIQSESKSIKKLLVSLGHRPKDVHIMHHSNGIEEIMRKIDRSLKSIPAAQRSRAELTVYNLAHGTNTSFGFHNNPNVNRNTFLQRIDECCNKFELRSQVVLAECYGHEYGREHFNNITVHALSSRESPRTVSYGDLHVDLECYILKSELELLFGNT